MAGDLLDFQTAPSNGFHLGIDVVPGRIDRLAPGRGRKPRRPHIDAIFRQHYTLGMKRIEQFRKPIMQQFFAIFAGNVERCFFDRSDGIEVRHHDREQASRDVREQIVQADGVCPNPDIGGVFKNFSHDSAIVAAGQRISSNRETNAYGRHWSASDNRPYPTLGLIIFVSDCHSIVFAFCV